MICDFFFIIITTHTFTRVYNSSYDLARYTAVPFALNEESILPSFQEAYLLFQTSIPFSTTAHILFVPSKLTVLFLNHETALTNIIRIFLLSQVPQNMRICVASLGSAFYL